MPLRGGHTGPAYTENGVISLRNASDANAYTSFLYATLIHEAFHLYGPENEQILPEMKKADRTVAGPFKGWGPLALPGPPGQSLAITGLVARHCGGL